MRMDNVVSLSRVRKSRDAAAKTLRAAENKRRFGRTKAEAAKDRLQNTQAAAKLDGLKLEVGE
jgi:hypothetical protein